MSRKKKLVDILVLIALLVIAACVTVSFSVSKVVSILLFFGLPCAYLIWKDLSTFKKSLIFASLFSIPLSVFVDTFAVFDGGWYVPHSIIPYRLFGVATFEVWLFGLLWVLFAVLFYEYFFDHHRASDWFPKIYRKLLWLFALLVIGVTATYLIKPSLLIIPYFYTWFSIIFVVPPLIWFLVRRQKFLPRFVLIGSYFFVVLLVYEIVALYVGLWNFPGVHFIGWVKIFGQSFPLEELIFYMVFATPSFLAYYEYFADNMKL